MGTGIDLLHIGAKYSTVLAFTISLTTNRTSFKVVFLKQNKKSKKENPNIWTLPELLALILEDRAGRLLLLAVEGPDLDGAGGGEGEHHVVLPVTRPQHVERGNPVRAHPPQHTFGVIIRPINQN